MEPTETALTLGSQMCVEPNYISKGDVPMESTGIKAFFKKCGRETYSSMAFMGVGQILNGQYVKGILYALAEVLIIVYFSLTGIKDFVGFFTLGTDK